MNIIQLQASIFVTDVNSTLISQLHPEIMMQRNSEFAELALGETWKMKLMGCSMQGNQVLLKMQLSAPKGNGDWYNYRFRVVRDLTEFTESQVSSLQWLADWEIENPSGSLNDESRPKLFFEGQGLIQFNIGQAETENGIFLYLTQVYWEGVELVGSGISRLGQRMAPKRYKSIPAVPPSLPPVAQPQATTRRRAAV